MSDIGIMKKYQMKWKWVYIVFALISPMSYGEDEVMDSEYFKKTHHHMVQLLLEVEKDNQYGSLYPVEGKTSFHKGKLIDLPDPALGQPKFFSLRNLLQFNVFAASRNLCFFGGWPSYKRRGLCKEPWKFNTDSSFGMSYDRNHYCGHDDMFRCNPILFGKGDGENSQDNNGSGMSAGKCINFKKNGGSIKTVTKQCYEETQDNLDSLYELYAEDENYREKFNKLKEEMTLFCTENSRYSACDYLLDRITTLENRFYCLENQDLNIGGDAIAALTEIPDHLKGRNLRAAQLRLEAETQEAPPIESVPIPRTRPRMRNDAAPAVSIRPVPRPEREVEREVAGGEACQFYDRFKRSGINDKALKQALYFYEKNKSRLSKERYISIADYGMRSNQKRFYILDMNTGEVQTEHVSHGSGNRSGRKIADSNHDGRLERCHHGNNINDRTNMTRGGFFITSSLRNSPNHGPSSWPSLDGRGNDSMWMDGVSPGVNDEARSSYVVMHGASYNRGSIMGRSYGCPAFRPERASSVINTIKGGSLYYSYIPQCSSLQSRVDRQVEGWQGMCQ